MQTTLAFIGDVMLGRGVNEEIGRVPPESFWGDVLPLLQSADAVIANLECAITEFDRPWSKTIKVFHFRADPAAVEVLRAANIRCVSLANNHTLDFQEQGLLDTLRHLDAAGISRAGAGASLAEAAAPVVFQAGGLKIGVVAMTDNEPPFAAGPDRPGTNYMEISTDAAALARVESAAAQARQAGADLVVLSLHWGPNMVLTPSPLFASFAAAAVDRGVHVIHGHSAHVFQAVQLCGTRLILYSTGDFLDDYAVDPDLRNDWSFIFLVEADADGLRRLRMVPVRLHYAQVALARGSEFEAIRNRMRRLCAEFRTPVSDTPDGLELLIRR